MEHFRLLNTFASEDSADTVYVSLDTVEGSECFGHWMLECAIFLPYISTLKSCIGDKNLKILLNTARRYKKVVLSDFDIYESDIVYSSKMTTHGHNWQENYVLPQDDKYICFIPNFMYTWPVMPDNIVYFNHVSNFMNNYKINVEKTIPYLYLQRSQKENYSHNARGFENITEVSDMLLRNGVTILNVDRLDSLKPQIETVRRAKTIILEMGSAFTLNAGWFAKDSHIIILNDFFNARTSSASFMQVLRKQMMDHNVTYESFTHQPNCHANFKIDVKALELRVKLNRDACIVCGDCNLSSFCEFQNFPIMAISNSSIANIFFDKKIALCNKCSCLQLQKLVDPDILYSSWYTNSSFSPAWKDHHEHFCDFILSSSSSSSFLEIGANNGALYKLLKQKRTISYSTLDMFKHTELPEEVQFIEGSCESYKYTGNTVIASHVFEHLYNPHEFIKQMKNGGVHEVFIAIPNFNYLLESQSMQTIHSQHTFYCGKEYIIYMFSKHGYARDMAIDYTGEFKSCFFKFRYTGCAESVLPTTDIDLYKKIYIDKVASIRGLVIPEKSYIMPSGIYGQFLYYFLTQKSHVLGFLDNNIARHGHTLYGTDKNVYHPSKVDLTDCVIAICKCPYTTEIVAELQTKYPAAKLLLLDQ